MTEVLRMHLQCFQISHFVYYFVIWKNADAVYRKDHFIQIGLSFV